MQTNIWTSIPKKIFRLGASYGLWRWGMATGEPVIAVVGIFFGMAELIQILEEIYQSK